jgi:hypothetical protein
MLSGVWKKVLFAIQRNIQDQKQYIGWGDVADVSLLAIFGQERGGGAWKRPRQLFEMN